MKIHRIHNPTRLPRQRLARTVLVQFHGEPAAELACVPNNVPVSEIAAFLGEKAGMPVLGWTPAPDRGHDVKDVPMRAE